MVTDEQFMKLLDEDIENIQGKIKKHSEILEIHEKNLKKKLRMKKLITHDNLIKKEMNL